MARIGEDYAAEREDDAVDDDDMPPLVEAPPMTYTYTFCTQMTPLSFDPASSETPEPTANALVPYTPAQPTASIEEVESYVPGPTRTSHARRRDASYIPRPPNAFILFRSSFIREQKVTGRVEGSHSNLSKIIGMYWKSLPKSERKAWKAKADQAQLDHRKRYPDWRFSPSANAAANAKVRLEILDGGGGGGSGRERRGCTSVRGAKDPPDKDGGGSGSGNEKFDDEDDEDDDDGVEDVEDNDDDSDYKEVPSRRMNTRRRSTRARANTRSRTRSTRTRANTRGRVSASGSGKTCVDTRKADAADNEEIEKEKRQEKKRAKIVELLSQGLQGDELEKAIEEWDRNRDRASPSPIPSIDDESQSKNKSRPTPPLIITLNAAPPSSLPPSTPTLSPAPSLLSPCSPPLSPGAGTTSYVHGVKRSLSAPAPEQRYVQVDMTNLKKHRSSTSVEVSVEGRHNKEVQIQRRETVSLPLPHARKMEYEYGGEYGYSGIQRSQTFPPMEVVHPTNAGFGVQRSVFDRYISAASGALNTNMNANTNTNTSVGSYYPTSIAPTSTYTWHDHQQQQQEPTYAANWWPSHAPIINTTATRSSYDYEPAREGSFDPVEGEYEPDGGVEYAQTKLDGQYLEVCEHVPSSSSATTAEEWTTLSVLTPDTTATATEARLYDALGSTFPPTQTQIGTQIQETPDAGGFFCPLAPCRLPESTFSSLTGWDGREMRQGQGQGQGAWYGWGSMQSVGLGGGGGAEVGRRGKMM